MMDIRSYFSKAGSMNQPPGGVKRKPDVEDVARETKKPKSTARGRKRVQTIVSSSDEDEKPVVVVDDSPVKKSTSKRSAKSDSDKKKSAEKPEIIVEDEKKISDKKKKEPELVVEDKKKKVANAGDYFATRKNNSKTPNKKMVKDESDVEIVSESPISKSKPSKPIIAKTKTPEKPKTPAKKIEKVSKTSEELNRRKSPRSVKAVAKVESDSEMEIDESPVLKKKKSADKSVKLKEKTPTPKKVKLSSKEDFESESPVKKVDKIKLESKPKTPTKVLKKEAVKPMQTSNEDFKRAPKVEPNPAEMMIVDKYKPKKLGEIIGQQGDRSNANKLLNWLSDWHSNHASGDKKKAKGKFGADDGSQFKAALLSGPPGIGKTTTATLVCEQLGFRYKELNASDVRAKKTLAEEGDVLQNKVMTNFFGSSSKAPTLETKHVLIMDEVDGMAGNEDRGGMAEVIQLIKKSKVPIICICNDRSSMKIRSLTNHCFDLRFYKPRAEQIKAAVRSICFKEKINVTSEALDEIILSSNQDIRQVLHYVNLVSANKSYKSGSKLSIKDIKLGPFDAIKKVFAGIEGKNMTIFEKSDLFFVDYGLMPLMVYENYLKTTPVPPKPSDLGRLKQVCRSIDAMAFSDVIEKRIRTSMNWSLLPLQAAYSTVMPSVYMNSSFMAMPMFPTYLGKLSNYNKRDRLLQDLKVHMNLKISGSKLALNLDYLEPLRDSIVNPLVKGDVDGAAELLNEYYLRKEDIESIMELVTYKGDKDPMTKVDSKTKAALTRKMNKEGEKLPYAYGDAGKKVKVSSVDDGMAGMEEEAAAEDENEDDDDPTKDAMVKKVEPKKTKAKKEPKEEAPKKPRATKKGKK
ncbi:Replication factor C subunit 1 [Halotydeus destructor]|nr:Replication factor C subunit 1 [Halotydeus destructor]